MRRNGFMKEMSGDNNHRLLLWDALEATKGNVVELGSGYGSTQYLRKYCKDTTRTFETYDYTEHWAKLHGSTYINDWDTINPKGSVILIDHSPGERRWIDIQRLKDSFEILVIHDSEPIGAGDYRYENIWHLFKYRIDVKCEGTWATAVSNTIDLSKFIGNKYNQYVIS